MKSRKPTLGQEGDRFVLADNLAAEVMKTAKSKALSESKMG